MGLFDIADDDGELFGAAALLPSFCSLAAPGADRAGAVDLTESGDEASGTDSSSAAAAPAAAAAVAPEHPPAAAAPAAHLAHYPAIKRSAASAAGAAQKKPPQKKRAVQSSKTATLELVDAGSVWVADNSAKQVPLLPCLFVEGVDGSGAAPVPLWPQFQLEGYASRFLVMGYHSDWFRAASQHRGVRRQQCDAAFRAVRASFKAVLTAARADSAGGGGGEDSADSAGEDSGDEAKTRSLRRARATGGPLGPTTIRVRWLDVHLTVVNCMCAADRAAFGRRVRRVPRQGAPALPRARRARGEQFAVPGTRAPGSAIPLCGVRDAERAR